MNDKNVSRVTQMIGLGDRLRAIFNVTRFNSVN